jgi:N-acetylmuramoyl-L-alanine amidase
MNKMTIGLFLTLTASACLQANPKLIMLDPAGHAKDTGRQLHHGYERAETYKCAEVLKRGLEHLDDVRVILSRTPGEELVPLQNASFANRFNADLVVRLSFYKETSDKAQIHLYYLQIDPLDDKNRVGQSPFTPINQAHIDNIQTSLNYAQKLANALSDASYQALLTCADPKGLPIKPLIGIVSPAILIEIGLPKDDQWQPLCEALISSLQKIITSS